MYLTSKHIQVALILKKSKIDDYKILSKMLSFTPSSFFSYLRDIERIILDKNETDIKVLMKDLRETSDLIYLMKQKQYMTKDERILYIFFKLLKDRVINITKLSQELSVTRRTLNYDLERIKLKLSTYNIILVPYKNIGLMVSGDEVNIRRMFLGYIIKIFIEKLFLPKILRNEFAKFLRETNFKQLSKTLCNLNIEDDDSFYYNEVVLNSSCLAFSYSPNEFKTTKIKLTDDFSLDILDILSNYFHDILKKRYYVPNDHLSQLNEYLFSFERIINLFFNFKINKDVYKIIPIKKWLVFLLTKNTFDIKDLYFINILKNDFPSQINSLTNKLKSKIPGTSLYDGFIIYFFISNLIDAQTIPCYKNSIFVYKNIPALLVKVIVKKIETIYSIKISSSIRVKDIGNYLNSNSVSTIYFLEDFDFKKADINFVKVSISDFFIS